MQFMVIENFRNQDAKAVYRRFRDKGRMAPDGLTYVASWVAQWSDLVAFEIVPVVAGKDTAAALAGDLG